MRAPPLPAVLGSVSAIWCSASSAVFGRTVSAASRAGSSPSGSSCPRSGRPSARRAPQVLAVSAGNALGFYDFVTYSYFATQIGATFFPAHDKSISLILSLATFGIGFLTRPIGAIVLGTMGDRIGRKPALILSFML